MSRKLHKEADNFEYLCADTLSEALTGADFVVISILPGTFDEMEIDVHEPEKYGIYQSVSDTAGPGGIIRALRTLPMFEEFALAIKQHCPQAWVINYTNPMTMCMRMLYHVFPEIKAFGCCYEVFGTQKLLVKVLDSRITAKYQTFHSARLLKQMHDLVQMRSPLFSQAKFRRIF